MSLEETDAALAAIATAPRVSLASMEAKIKAKYECLASAICYGPVDDNGAQFGTLPELEILSVCILVMQNGFTIIGKAAPASPDNFNRDLGCKFAYEDAIRQLWPLEGYALRERLQNSPLAG